MPESGETPDGLLLNLIKGKAKVYQKNIDYNRLNPKIFALVLLRAFPFLYPDQSIRNSITKENL